MLWLLYTYMPKKRTFKQIRNIILKNLKEPLSVSQVAKRVDCDIRTAKRHLIWLLGNEEIKKYKKGNRIFYIKR